MGGAMVAELNEQFGRQWEMLREIVDNVPDDQWISGDVPQLVPARLAYHILSGTEVYARSTTYEEYVARRSFPADWQAMPANELPDRRTTRHHIDGLEKAVERWLESLEDDGLLEEDAGFAWTGSRRLGRALYLLRHTQNHIGEANSELRRRGLNRGKWR